MPPKDDSLSIVTLLGRLTQEDKLRWTAQEPPKEILQGTDDLISTVYTTEFKGRRIAVFERKYQDFTVEYDRFYWTSEVVVAILHPDDTIAFRFSNIGRAGKDLLETIQYQDANVDGLLQDLLKEK